MDIFKILKHVGRLVILVEGPLDTNLRKKVQARSFPNLTLYHFVVSPYAAKVRRYLAKNNLKIMQKDILESDKFYRELLQGGKLDQVPCLRIAAHSNTASDQDRWLYESDEIIKYLKAL